MKKLIKTSLMTALLACSFNPLYASGNHDHGHSHDRKEVSKLDVQNVAAKEIKRLVKRGKLDNGWINSPVSNMEKKKYNNEMEWVIRYKNNSIQDVKKQNLYVFVNLYGEITGVNHSGE
jgi:hypothetical protein